MKYTWKSASMWVICMLGESILLDAKMNRGIDTEAMTHNNLEHLLLFGDRS